MIFRPFLFATLILMAVGCTFGGPDSTEAPTEPSIAPTPTIRTPLRTRPTPTPRPASVPTLIPTEVPVIPPTLDNSNDEHPQDQGQKGQPNDHASNPPEEGASPVEPATVVPTPTLEPTPTVKPTPTPRWRPAPKPQGVTGYKGFDITSGPVIHNNVLSVSAVIDGQNIVPSEVQVWQSLRKNDDGGRCLTDKPIALIANSAAGGTSPIQWEFCSYLGAKPVIDIDSVPWITGTWTYTKRDRRRTTDPYLANWSLSVSLSNDLVEDLEYPRPEGYTIIIFAGDTILAKVWIDY